MITIDLYIFRQILRPLAGALLVALLVLLIERMLRLLDFVLGSNGPVEVVFEILAYLVPHYMALALPISLYLGILLGFNRLSRDGEIASSDRARRAVRQQSLCRLDECVPRGASAVPDRCVFSDSGTH